MKLIKKLIEQQKLAEDAAGGAVGAGAVAGFSTPLFASLSKRDLPKKIRITKIKKEKKPRGKGLGIQEMFAALAEDQAQISGDTFDTTEVISKLKSLQNKETVNNADTQAFALEDDDGNLVKVRVRAEQGPNFEAALNAFLSQHEDEEEQRGVPEIAEILFKLKDRFDIVDVEWPEVPEDQEEAVDVAGGGEPGTEGQPEGEPGAEGDLAALGGAEGEPGAEGDLAALGGAEAGGEGEVKSLLTQVIDMMKADAEARKAEAHARSSEAKAREAELATQQVYAKVKQEEQFLDMETEQKKQKETEKEAKRLAQLARWKHEMETEEGDSFDPTGGPSDVATDTAMPGMGQPEDEETAFMRRVHQPKMRAPVNRREPAATSPQHASKKPRFGGRVAPHDVASFILSRVK